MLCYQVVRVEVEARPAPGGVVRVLEDLGELVAAGEVAEEVLATPKLGLQRQAADGGGGRRPATDVAELSGQ